MRRVLFGLVTDWPSVLSPLSHKEVALTKEGRVSEKATSRQLGE